MKPKKWIALAVLGACLTLALLSFKPVAIPEEKDCLTVTGYVAEIYESGTKDISFKLKGNDQRFYINRGMDRGLDLEKLKSDLIGQHITIKHPDYWTSLDPSNSIRHIAKLEHEGVTIFNELE